MNLTHPESITLPKILRISTDPLNFNESPSD